MHEKINTILSNAVVNSKKSTSQFIRYVSG